MIEDIEELGIETEDDAMGQRNLLGNVELRVGEMGTTELIATRVAKLTVCGRIASGTGSRARVNH